MCGIVTFFRTVCFFPLWNLTTKRCGGGISPMLWKNIIGKKSKNNFKKDQIIKIEK